MTKVREVMTHGVAVIDEGDTVATAARLMRDHGIGDVVVTAHEKATGILTDRDVTIRAVAEGLDPASTSVGDVATHDLVTVEADADLSDAEALMRRHDIRRLPVVEDGFAVGFLTLGDLAIAEKPASVLGEISAAPDDF